MSSVWSFVDDDRLRLGLLLFAGFFVDQQIRQVDAPEQSEQVGDEIAVVERRQVEVDQGGCRPNFVGLDHDGYQFVFGCLDTIVPFLTLGQADVHEKEAIERKRSCRLVEQHHLDRFEFAGCFEYFKVESVPPVSEKRAG